jgi:hypothetical protein
MLISAMATEFQNGNFSGEIGFPFGLPCNLASCGVVVITVVAPVSKSGLPIADARPLF